MILFEETDGPHMRLEVSGKLGKEDYEELVPRVEEALEHGRTRILVRLHDFEGWTASALWEELKFDIRHRKDFDRIAIVGESKWEEWGTKLTSPFFGGEVRYFDEDHADEAEAWLLMEAGTTSTG